MITNQPVKNPDARTDTRTRMPLLVVATYSFFWNAVLAQFEVITLDHLGSRYNRYSQVRVWGSIGFIGTVVGLGWLFDVIAVTALPVVMALLLGGIWLCSLWVTDTRGRYRQASGVWLGSARRSPWSRRHPNNRLPRPRCPGCRHPDRSAARRYRSR